jgi:hypothetical protein
MERKQNIGNFDEKGFISRAYDSVREYSNGLIRKGLVGLVAGTMALNAYAADGDRDGITDADEAIIGTNPSLADTDLDGYPDGMDQDPLDFVVPEYPKSESYGMSDQTALLVNDPFNDRSSPALSNDEAKLAYFKTNTGTSEPSLMYVSNLASPSESLLANITHVATQISFSLDDAYVYFSDSEDSGTTIDLYRVDVGGKSVENLTNLPSGQEIKSPFAVRLSRSSSVLNKDWLVTSTNGVNGGASEITAYPIVSGNPNFSSPVSLADLQNLPGSELWPKLNKDGTNLLFGVAYSSTNFRTFVARGIEDILLGNTSKITSFADGRLDSASNISLLSKPIGFSSTGDAFYVTSDFNDVFDFSLLNFDEADFDIVAGSMSATGTNVLSRTRMPMEGDQFSGTVSGDGTRIIYSSNNDFTSETTSNLFEGAVTSYGRANWETGVGVGDVRVRDPSGVTFNLLSGTDLTLPGASPNGTITMKSLSLVERIAASGDVEVRRVFGPAGAEFGDGATITVKYLDSDFTQAQEDAGITIKKLDPVTGEVESTLTTVGEPDTINNTVTAEMPGFSQFGVSSKISGEGEGEGEEPVPQGMPAAGALGLGLATGLVAAGGVWGLRRRKRDLGFQVEFPSEEK